MIRQQLITRLDLVAAREKFTRDIIRNEKVPYAYKRGLADLLEKIIKRVQKKLGVVEESRQREMRDINMELHAFRGDLTRLEYEVERQRNIGNLRRELDLIQVKLDEMSFRYKSQQERVDLLRKEYVLKSQVPPFGDPVLHAQHMSALSILKLMFTQGKALYDQRKKMEASYRELVRE